MERLSDIKKGPNDNVRGCKTLSNVEPMYLEVKLKEPMFDWWVYRLKSKIEKTSSYFWG